MQMHEHCTWQTLAGQVKARRAWSSKHLNNHTLKAGTNERFESSSRGRRGFGLGRHSLLDPGGVGAIGRRRNPRAAPAPAPAAAPAPVVVAPQAAPAPAPAQTNVNVGAAPAEPGPGPATVEADSGGHWRPNRYLLMTGLIVAGAPYIASMAVAGTSGHDGDSDLGSRRSAPGSTSPRLRGGCPRNGASCGPEIGNKALLVGDGILQSVGVHSRSSRLLHLPRARARHHHPDQQGG